MNGFYRDLDHGITMIDTDLGRPGCGAAYLLVEKGEAVFVETGPPAAATRLLAVLDAKGIAREAVSHVLVTHVHLDHAGGSGELLESLPRAQLVVHPRGSRHMADPTRLMEGSRSVYGDELYDQAFGAIKPVPEGRILPLERVEGHTLDIAGRTITLMDTPGHTTGHICYIDRASDGIFTGDAYGISYRELDVGSDLFLFPATTPFQFDPKAFHQSIDRIAALQLTWIYLTHYGPIRGNRWLADDLHRQTDRLKALTMGLGRFTPEERKERLTSGMEKVFLSRLQSLNSPLSREEKLKYLAMDIELNVQGLLAWLERKG